MTIISEQLLMSLFFATIVYFHVAKKNFGVAIAYGAQSFIIVILLTRSFFETGSVSLLLIAFLLLIIKVILVPSFVVQLIKKHELKFLVSSYVNIPLTLIIVAALTAIAHLPMFMPLVNIIPSNQRLLSMALSALFISFFLIVNRKGALSQIIGILSLENSIVVFAFFAGLEQTPALQLGIIFDLSIWIVTATVFISMIYKHFGSLDITSLKSLKD